MDNTLLRKMGFSEKQIAEYNKYEKIIGDKFDAVVKDFYDKKISLDDAFVACRKMFCDINGYTIDLIVVVKCAVILKDIYTARNLPSEIYYCTIKDIGCKVNECEKYLKVFGIFCGSWHEGFFRLYRFGMKRLQFNDAVYSGRDLTACGFTLKNGDFVSLLHIPSLGRLDYGDCVESYKTAYDFFRGKLKNGIFPVICDSYLLFPPYKECFGKDTNIGKFIGDFKVFEVTELNAFTDSWRIFNKSYDGSTEGFPAQTSLQRNFIKYLNDGGKFGNGKGILLFDGEKVMKE